MNFNTLELQRVQTEGPTDRQIECSKFFQLFRKVLKKSDHDETN